MAKFSRKRHRNLDDLENLNAITQDCWFGGAITTTNRFSTLSGENIVEEAKQSTETKPPPNFIPGVKNIEPRTELLNEIAKDKYLVTTLYSDQVRVQPTESSVYTTIVKELMGKKYRISHLQAKTKRSLRVIL